jgi:hypothetical protein
MRGAILASRRKTSPLAILSTTNSTYTDLGAKPAIRAEKPETKLLSYDIMKPIRLIDYDGVRLCLRTAAITGLLFIPRVKCERGQPWYDDDTGWG